MFIEKKNQVHNFLKFRNFWQKFEDYRPRKNRSWCKVIISTHRRQQVALIIRVIFFVIIIIIYGENKTVSRGSIIFRGDGRRESFVWRNRVFWLSSTQRRSTGRDGYRYRVTTINITSVPMVDTWRPYNGITPRWLQHAN